MKHLINQRVEFFDESGGVLDARGNYVTDWWDVNPIILTNVINKYFFVKEEGFQTVYKYKLKKIIDISENMITLKPNE